MEQGKANVRWYVERIPGVTGTWFEWSDEGNHMSKTLVVEVDFNTDPNSEGFRRPVLDAIQSTVRDVLVNETTWRLAIFALFHGGPPNA